jgi:hypothetical protein
VSLQERSRTPADDAWAIRIKKRAGWKCEWCGLTIGELKRLGGQLHAAHIKPRSEWPGDALDDSNGKALCTFKDPRHRHPQGIGGGFGCHNSMSGHWNNGATMHTSHRLAKRHKLLNVVLGIPVWMVAVILNAQLRYFAFLRPYTLGLPVHGGDFLMAGGILVGLYLACVGAIDYSLRHRFLSRGARGILHGLVRLARKAKEPRRASGLR